MNRRTWPASALGIVAALSLVLTACGSGGSDDQDGRASGDRPRVTQPAPTVVVTSTTVSIKADGFGESGSRPAPTSPPTTAAPAPPAPAAPAGSTVCDPGLSVNAVTSCPFARAVRDTYQGFGGQSVIDVYSPVTKLTYTMTCTGAIPVVCRGGNNAEVYIR